jgi:phytol kinase
MWLTPYFPSPWIQDIVATLGTFALMLIWLRALDALAERRIVSQQLSRKIIHIGTGPIFLICWNLYSFAPQARWLAALVPLSITMQFAAVGLGWMEDPAAVAAMSRSGNRREILQGPLYYGIIFVLATVLFWRSTPLGIVPLMILCGGDGFADVIGRRWGSAKLPWSPGKSWVGTAAMFFGSLTIALSMSLAFRAWGYFGPTPAFHEIVVAVLLISIVATAVETLPLEGVDNVTVFVSALATSLLLITPFGVWQPAVWTL